MIEIYEAAERIGIKLNKNFSGWIKRLEKATYISLIYKNDKVFISEKDLKKLQRNRDNNIPYDVQILDGYLTRNEAVKKYQITYHSLRQQEKNGTIKIIKEKGISLLEENSLKKLKKSIEEIESIRKNDNWIKISDLYKNGGKYDKVLITINRNDFHNDVKSVYYGKKEERFITKKLYEEIISGKYEIIDYNNEIKSILPDDIKSIIDKLILNLENKKNNKLILINDVSSLIQINYDDLMLVINKLNIEVVNLNGNNYIYKYKIEKIMANYGFYSIKKLSKTTGIVQSTLCSNFNNANISNLFSIIELDNDIYFTIESIEETLKEYSKKYISTLNLDEIERQRVKLLPRKLPITLELVIEFIHSKKSSYKKSYGEDTTNFTRLINSIESLIYYLDKEVFNCNSDYILNIISDKEKIKTGYLAIICQFLNFVKRKLKGKCRFTKQFGKSVIEQYVIDNGNKIDSKIYDKETWSKYYLILKDIDRHIENSICDSRYSECWLYCILNLAVTWRKKNILLSVPRIKLEEIGIYEFEWFNEKNKFSLDMANSVLEQIKFSLDGLIAYKNKKNLHFNIPLSLKIPTAIALIISEIHSRNNKEKLMFYNLNRSDIRKNDYKKIFKDDNLLDFQNIKCTRSIITYGYSYAVNQLGMAPAAYEIYRRGRSHTNYDQKLNNVTGNHYLVLDNLENGPKEYMYNIIERGAFGFVYYKLFQCIIEKEKFNSLNQDDITELTKLCNSNVNSMSLEKICNFFIEYSNINKINVFELLWYNSINKSLKKQENKNEFINRMIELYKVKANELLGECDKFSEFIEYKYRDIDRSLNLLIEENCDLKNVLIRISNGESSCYTEHTNCIFDRLEREEKCPYNYGEKGGSSCIGCKYNLITVYALNEVSHRLKRLLDNIDNKDLITDEEIIKNSHLVKSYLSLIIEASIHFGENEFINNIVNLVEIKKKIIALKNKNKIINF